MSTIRVDTHTHLYPTYPLKLWCDAAYRNLQVSGEHIGVVCITDRIGQDSFARFREEGRAFGIWREYLSEVGEGLSREAVFEWEGKKLSIVRGVQYVSLERVEVLGIGVGRSVPDGAPASELVDVVVQDGGVPCLPWSPGKWLGKRGALIARIINEASSRRVTFGDIALRSAWGPFSPLLARASKEGRTVLLGTDPLPREADSELVGSFGIEISPDSSIADTSQVLEVVRSYLLEGKGVRPWGSRNSLMTAFSRFISTL
jgi:hypothetical protein